MINGSILKRRISAIARLTVLIPIRATHRDIMLPGFMEADRARRSGNTLAGDFVWSLPLSDILTGWTECRVKWSKGLSGVLDQINLNPLCSELIKKVKVK